MAIRKIMIGNAVVDYSDLKNLFVKVDRVTHGEGKTNIIAIDENEWQEYVKKFGFEKFFFDRINGLMKDDGRLSKIEIDHMESIHKKLNKTKEWKTDSREYEISDWLKYWITWVYWETKLPALHSWVEDN